jgi:hypothetical protein
MNRRSTVGLALTATCLVGPFAPAAHAADPPTNERSVPRSTAIVVHTPDDFDWGDAAIGAAAGVGSALAAAGGMTLARNK